jgi:hypothetical protein
MQGDTAWEAPTEMTLADWQGYLDDRKSRGFNTVLIQITNPILYSAVEHSPFAVQLGGLGAGAAALPFLKNISGGTWDGDPTFFNDQGAHNPAPCNCDASLAQPNDAYYSWIGQMIDEAATRGMLIVATPLYLGFNQGAQDGWWRTLNNAGNTQAVASGYGMYLAQGNGGTFAGFKSKTNVIWEDGVDMTPSEEAGPGAEGTLRYQAFIQGMRSGGATQLRGGHWKHDFLSTDDATLGQFMNLEAIYTHGEYPALGPTYGRARLGYTHSPAMPTYLTETTYEAGCASDSQVAFNAFDSRRFYWSSALSGSTGGLFGSNRVWTVGTAQPWQPNAVFAVGDRRTNGAFIYQVASVTLDAKSGTAGPSGNTNGIVDNHVIWNCFGGDWKQNLGSPHTLDFQRMGQFLDGVAWWRLVPSAVPGMKTLVTAGTGTFTNVTQLGVGEVGGDDWIVAAATPDGASLVAYVPPAHVGSFTVDLTALAGQVTARWIDPTNGGSTPVGTFTNTGQQIFSIPSGNNSGGSTDWVLDLEAH